MAFWLILLLFVASTVVSALLQKKPPDAKASGLGDFQAPTAQEGRVIPVVFGTVKISGPNVVWFGDLEAAPIKRKSGLFSKSTVGYKYYIGIEMALCRGFVDALVSVFAGQAPDDTNVPLSDIADFSNFTDFTLNGANLFGGEDNEGGLWGGCVFYKGSDAGPDEYLEKILGVGNVPAYYGICRLVLKHVYVGTSNYIKNISPVVRRCPSNLGLSPTITNINGDANPIEIIYEAMTSTEWGLGIPGARFDLASFEDAAQVLKDEGFGISMIIDSTSSADQLISEVCRHIDGVVFTDPATGQWTMKLARNDYVVGDLLNFGPAEISEKPEFNRGSWEETLNEIKVKFIDRSTFKERVVQAHESANLATTGLVASAELDYHGISNVNLAQTIAMRELITHSYPMARVRFKANRKAWQLRMGSAFTYSWPDDDVADMVMRVTSINYGNLLDGAIEVEAVQDVFAVAYDGYDVPDDSGWEDPAPTSVPAAPDGQLAMEAPYQFLPTTLAQVRVGVSMTRPDGITQGYEVWANEGAGYYNSNRINVVTPGGTLTAAYLRNTSATDATGFTLQNVRDMIALVGTDTAGRARGECLLIFLDTGELCAYKDVTDNLDGTFTIAGIVRGIYDTLPADHALGARVMFLLDGGTPYFFDYKADVVDDVSDDDFLVNGV